VYSILRPSIFAGNSAAVFFCGMPTTAPGPVLDAITPIFIWACAVNGNAAQKIVSMNFEIFK
jgi:hypothetical protein